MTRPIYIDKRRPTRRPYHRWPTPLGWVVSVAFGLAVLWLAGMVTGCGEPVHDPLLCAASCGYNTKIVIWTDGYCGCFNRDHQSVLVGGVRITVTPEPASSRVVEPAEGPWKNLEFKANTAPTPSGGAGE